MRHSFAAVLCFVSLLASAAPAQSPDVAPVRVAAGPVLKFHLEARLNPTAADALDALPKGTVLEVRMLDSIDSAVDHDGAEFSRPAGRSARFGRRGDYPFRIGSAWLARTATLVSPAAGLSPSTGARFASAHWAKWRFGSPF